MNKFWIKGLRRNKPRWLVVLADILLMCAAFVLSFVLIFKHRGVLHWETMLLQLFLVTAIYGTSFLIFQPFRSVIHQTGLRDLRQVAFTTGAAFLVLAGIVRLVEWVDWIYPNLAILLPFSHTQLLLHAFLTGFGMAFIRIAYRSIYHSVFWRTKEDKIAVILFGAGNMGNTTFHFLQAGSRNKYKVVAVLDDNPTRIGKRIQGLTVHPLGRLDAGFLEKFDHVEQLIIAIDDHYPERLKRIFKQAEPLQLAVKIIPTSARLLAGELATRQIRTLRVEDLLGRKPIDLKNTTVLQALKGKVILITGGAGSIGSELVRQIGRSACAKLVVVDQSESPLYEVQQELYYYDNKERFEFIVGNVRDESFMEAVFRQHRPHMLFHAAAYKHVPLMEANPYEAIFTNVWGSFNVAQLADRYGVEKFVMISTDKAINPTNVMGATKRIAEMTVAAFNQESNTNYIVTRFGNVLGSNGSVIPLFEKQIQKGGPITITHPDITRYFMTIPEACQLVQEAGIMGAGGEVFVFDMGEPVKIMDLAKQMIRLKGLAHPEDINIVIAGLRPGEKIFEELLADNENTLKTHHEKIMIARVNTDDVLEKKKRIGVLCELVKRSDPNENRIQLVTAMKEIVPEFISQNSIFATLDKAIN